MDLNDEQWQILEPLVTEKPRRRGRISPVSYQTCHRRFQQWARDGTLKRVLRALAQDLRLSHKPFHSW